MGRIIAIANQKGGVGKTTTAINLSACLAEAKQRVLVIDIDPQGNTTSGLGIDKEEKENTIYEVMLGEISIEQAICKEAFDCLDVIPSNVNLAGAEIDLIDIEDREYILKKSIAQIRKNYDYIILDCPPSLSMLTVNAMTAADTVLVPIQCFFLRHTAFLCAVCYIFRVFADCYQQVRAFCISLADPLMQLM